jgi:hypothetical protein
MNRDERSQSAKGGDMSHTPGPWRYDSGKIWTPRGWWVASVYEDMEEDIKGANGRLLAAAPDLLSALMMAVSALERSDYIQMDSFDVIEVSRAAIAKARGEI